MLLTCAFAMSSMSHMYDQPAENKKILTPSNSCVTPNLPCHYIQANHDRHFSSHGRAKAHARPLVYSNPIQLTRCPSIDPVSTLVVHLRYEKERAHKTFTERDSQSVAINSHRLEIGANKKKLIRYKFDVQGNRSTS